MKFLASLLTITGLVSAHIFAQNMPNANVPQGENLKIPQGWEVRLDMPMEKLTISSEPDSGDIYFVNMTPGWHITTGPRAIFWHPQSKTEGDFTISSSIYLFDTKGRDREGFGLFFGGENLQDENQEYIYFLIRNTGDYLIKSRSGAETKEITKWTPSEAIIRYTEETESSALNKLSVKVEDKTVTFYINDTIVMKSEKELNTDGLFGLRVNHAVNIHVSDLALAKE